MQICLLLYPFRCRNFGNLFDIEVKKCEEQALSYTGLLKTPVVIPNAFPLAMYDHYKCTSATVQVLIKQDVLTCPPRIKRYSSLFWNCGRPYMRCVCDGGATNGCKDIMLWFDHAMWFMINSLGRFFDSAYVNFMAKFAAFVTWISSAVKKAIKAQITFMNTRRMMKQASLEYAINPEAKLLANYYEALGAR